MTEPVKIVLAGIGGYGGKYVRDLFKGGSGYPYELIGVVDPYPDNSPYKEEIIARHIPIYDSLESFYQQSNADLAVISSPIQFHSAQTCLALSNGSHVLCEKPVSVTVEEAQRMMAARDTAGKFVSIGYQWCYSEGIQKLKRDILGGLFGKPKRLRTMVLWPRAESYYARGWAGKQRDGQGRLILDSVASNATAHYIHNMFYVLGSEIGSSARPVRVTAELYRANSIENYDTAAMRAYTEEGAELLYYGSHAVHERVGALLHYEFEQAVITYDDTVKDGTITARFHNGETKLYENPNADGDNKLWAAVAAVRGENRIVCGPEAALSHTLCIHAMQSSAKNITNFPPERIKRADPLWNGEPGYYVERLVDQLRHCYELAMLPAEAGYDWSAAGREIKI